MIPGRGTYSTKGEDLVLSHSLIAGVSFGAS